MRWDEHKLKIFDVDGQGGAGERSDRREVSPDLLVQQVMMMARPQETPAPDDDREATIERMIAQYLAETYVKVFEFERIYPRDSAAGRIILASSPQVLRIYACTVLQMMLEQAGARGTQLQPLLTAILRRIGDVDEALLHRLVSQLAAYSGRYLWPLPSAVVIGLVERYLIDHPLSDPLRSALEDLRRLYKVRADVGEERAIFRRLERLLSAAEAPDAPLTFCTGEAWTIALAAAVNEESPPQRPRWRALLDHAAAARSSAPRPAWLKQAAVLRDAVGEDAFRRVVGECLQAIGEPGEADKFDAPFEHRTDPTQVHEQYSDLLRGLVWCAGGSRADELVPLLGAAAARCFERIPGKQPRSLKIASACIQALGMYRSREALAELMRLQTRARQASVKKKIAAAIDELRQAVPLALHELEEFLAPDLELSELGVYRYSIGRHTASIHIESPGITRLMWESANAPPRRSVPPAVRSFHGDEWARVRKRHREITVELPRLKLRLERLLIADAQWDLATFRQRYLDQPLVGPFARAMIWSLTTDRGEVAAIWHEDQWRDAAHRPVGGIGDRTRVRPWHPLTAAPNEVLHWQCYLEDRGICQPFKQAHREIYCRLPEEADDARHSERFARHLVDSFRLEQIVPARGWFFRDTSELASLHSPEWELPEWNLRARWVTRPFSNVERRVPAGPNSLGVMFESLDTNQALPLGEVPAVVYSEVMRDIECYFIQYGAWENFVVNYRAACDGWVQDYWMRMALGPLSVQGQMRRAVVERLLPRSKLAKCGAVCDEFLRIDGERNRYHIHLGSGTVLMGEERRILHPYGYAFTPEHLGLPPASAFPQLPFGGDIRLANILRDAARLAHESKITEFQLLEQIVDK